MRLKNLSASEDGRKVLLPARKSRQLCLSVRRVETDLARERDSENALSDAKLNGETFFGVWLEERKVRRREIEKRRGQLSGDTRGRIWKEM